jgi:hypothetical protein
MRTYNQGWRRPKWKALRGSNAKIQTQVIMGGEGARGVTKEPKVLQSLKNVKAIKSFLD